MALPTGTRIGRYRIIEEIGRGATCLVYRAHDDALDVDVAVKVLADNLATDPDIRARFIEEAQLLRRLVSPDLLAVYDIGEHAGQPYLVLELATGGTLEQRRGSSSPSDNDTSELTDFLARALSLLHRHNVVHRDVKPNNILITGDATGQSDSLLQPGERYVLADLGLAKNLDDGSNYTMGVGSAGFSAPEQNQAYATITTAADVYGASAVLAWFAGKPDRSIPPEDRLADVTPPLRKALLHGLQTDPAARPSATAWQREVAASISSDVEPEVLGDINPTPAPPSRSGRPIALVAATLGAIVVAAVAWSQLAGSSSKADATRVEVASAMVEPSATAAPQPTATPEPTATAVPTATASPTATAEPSPTAEPTATPAPNPVANEGAGTLDSPFSLAGASVTHDKPTASWDVKLHALIEVQPSRTESGDRCLVLLGSLTPLSTSTGDLAPASTAPSFVLGYNDELVPSTGGNCEIDEIEAAGYRWIREANVTVGTPFAFFDRLLLPEDQALESIAIKGGFGTEPVYFTADVTTDVPSTAPTAPPPAGSVASASEIAGAAFDFESRSTRWSVDWSVELSGVVETAVEGAVDNSSRCLVLLGTITPTDIADRTITPMNSAPPFGIRANGVYEPASMFACDVAEIEEQGYSSIGSVQLTAQTVFPFFDEFVIPADGELGAIVIGDPAASDAAQLSIGELLEAASPAEPSDAPPIDLETVPLIDASLNFTTHQGAEWVVDMIGLIDGPPQPYYPDDRCVALVGTITPTDVEPGLLSNGLDAPQFGVIAAGRYLESPVGLCKNADINELGYGIPTTADVANNTAYAFVESFLVPDDHEIDAVVVGSPHESGEIYLDADYVTSVPAAE